MTNILLTGAGTPRLDRLGGFHLEPCHFGYLGDLTTRRMAITGHDLIQAFCTVGAIEVAPRGSTMLIQNCGGTGRR